MDTVSQILLQCVTDLLAFLELSEDSVVDPDAAVAQMEGVAHSLQWLTPGDRRALIEGIRALADKEEAEDKRSFLIDLPEGLGLA